jgi:hypothetical protein
MAEKDAEIWTLSFFRSEKVRKFTIKYCKVYFPNFSSIKNDKVQLSASFSAIKNDKVQLSELFPPLSFFRSEKARKVGLNHF